MASEQFSLCWDNFHKNMSTGMNSLLENEDLVDVTLAVQGKLLKAHKMVLSVCSPYFKELFKSNPCQHPIVFMKDVSYEALSDLLQFMYQGEVQVSQENLSTFIKTAEALQIKGLTGDGNGSADNEVTEVEPAKHTPQVESLEYKAAPRPKKQLPSSQPMTSPSIKRPRLSVPAVESTSVPQQIAKMEPSNSSQSVPPKPESVHFKMEPYDSSMSLIDESGDDNFGEDALDETGADETEDYSMMESGTGEEPQAGTSTDGAGEGQVGRQKRKFFSYSDEAVKQALLEIRQNGISLREAHRRFGVPRSTLQGIIKGKTSERVSRKTGPAPIMSVEEEQKIAEWLVDIAKCGLPLKKADVLHTVTKIANDNGKLHLFKNKIPSQKWYINFMKRHPEISSTLQEASENLEH